MAKIRGGSTVAGKQIVTMDIMNEFIYQIQTSELEDKMRKSEKDTTLNNFNQANDFIKDRNKNGLWQINNGTNNSDMYNYGNIFNISGENARFQFYAPHKENEKSALYFRTGWNDDIKSWEMVSTKTMLDTGLNLKYDKTGGDITGNVLASGAISTRNMFQFITSDNKYIRQSITNGKYVFQSSASTINQYSFDNDLVTSGDMFVNTSSRVWHQANLNPDTFVSRDPQIMSTGSSANNLKSSGYYYCGSMLHLPQDVVGPVYLEVIRYNNSNVLQKVYGVNGTKMYARTLSNDSWSPWKTMNGTLSYSQSISTSSWTSTSDGVYEMSITHGLNTENIASVVVTDTNKISMMVGFQTVSVSAIKVLCTTNPAGKVVINALQ